MNINLLFSIFAILGVMWETKCTSILIKIFRFLLFDLGFANWIKEKHLRLFSRASTEKLHGCFSVALRLNNPRLQGEKSTDLLKKCILWAFGNQYGCDDWWPMIRILLFSSGKVYVS